MIWAWLLKHWKLSLMALILACASISVGVQTWRVGEYRKSLIVAEKALAGEQEKVVGLEKLRAADQAATAGRVEYVTVVKREAEKRNEKSTKALQANPDWANAPVPDAVLDSLH